MARHFVWRGLFLRGALLCEVWYLLFHERSRLEEHCQACFMMWRGLDVRLKSSSASSQSCSPSIVARHAVSPVARNRVDSMSTKSHPAYKKLIRLFSRAGRSEACRFIVEGATFIRMGPRTLFVRRSKWEADAGELLAALADGGEEGPNAFAATTRMSWGTNALADSGSPSELPGVCVVDDSIFDDLSNQEASQGVICIFPIPRSSIAGAASWPRRGRVVVLDGVQDSVNVGVILRTMEAFAAKTLICLRGTVDIYNPKVARGSMGAVVRGNIELMVAKDAEELRQMLTGFRVFTAAGPVLGAVRPTDLGRLFTGKDAFIFGSEARGISEEIHALGDVDVHIPMCEEVESLNVAVAAGIILHAAAVAAEATTTKP